jgi:drug/metabolite transporter (DMT)-like permease
MAVPIVLVGIALISGLGGGAYGANPERGVLLGLLTAFFYAGYLILIRRGGQDLRRPAGPVAVATASTVAAGAVIGLLMGDLDPRPAPASLGWLALLGVTSQSAGYLLISLSLPRLPAVMTSILLLTQPVATLGLSMLLLGEAPSGRQLAGVALVIGGIAAATLGGGRSAIAPGRSGGTR